MDGPPPHWELPSTWRARRGRRPYALVAAAIVAALAGVVGIRAALSAHAVHRQGPAVHRAVVRQPTPRPAPSPSPIVPRTQRAPRWGAFARAHGLTVYLPVAHPVAVAYHEAALHGAYTMRPLGHLLRNANSWKFTAPPDRPGPGYTVMSSRGRPMPATSAADVVLHRGTHVRSPVTGVVTDIRRYLLYCRYADDRVAIRPAGHADDNVQVVLIHLARLRVHRGERVFATLSVLGEPRVFPFRSQVDDYVSGGYPHVHIEVSKPSAPKAEAC